MYPYHLVGCCNMIFFGVYRIGKVRHSILLSFFFKCIISVNPIVFKKSRFNSILKNNTFVKNFSCHLSNKKKRKLDAKQLKCYSHQLSKKKIKIGPKMAEFFQENFNNRVKRFKMAIMAHWKLYKKYLRRKQHSALTVIL